MQNVYYIARHGRSLANEAGIVVSRLDNGVLPQYGLADAGREQARAAGAKLREHLAAAGTPPEALHVYASPFSRTQQTAQEICGALGIDASRVQTEHALRERFFGDALELGPHSRYEEVWKRDAEDPRSDASGGGESVAQVAAGLARMLGAIEAKVQGGTVLLSHGDTLQILQAVAARTSADDLSTLAQHRRFKLETAELRRLTFDNAAVALGTAQLA